MADLFKKELEQKKQELAKLTKKLEREYKKNPSNKKRVELRDLARKLNDKSEELRLFIIQERPAVYHKVLEDPVLQKAKHQVFLVFF